MNLFFFDRISPQYDQPVQLRLYTLEKLKMEKIKLGGFLGIGTLMHGFADADLDDIVTMPGDLFTRAYMKRYFVAVGRTVATLGTAMSQYTIDRMYLAEFVRKSMNDTYMSTLLPGVQDHVVDYMQHKSGMRASITGTNDCRQLVLHGECDLTFQLPGSDINRQLDVVRAIVGMAHITMALEEDRSTAVCLLAHLGNPPEV
jgi:hypothetical protein